MERKQIKKYIGVEHIDLPPNVLYIINTLYEKGYEAYVVGGSIRDILLSIKPTDYDITTNALPNEIKKIFKNTIDTGIKHGTITILLQNEENQLDKYEITTYRIDRLYEDFRHPSEVEFTSNLKNDLYRRDFTINAFAYNDKNGFIDEYNGLKDLNEKVINCVGNPYDRFKEDALRMMRAIRFASQLGFNIEKNTYEAICVLSKNLKKVSKERIQIELTKTLLSKNPNNSKLFFTTKLSKYITSDFDKIEYSNQIYTNKIHIAYASLLFNNINISKNILKELKLDNNTINNTLLLLENINTIDFGSINEIKFKYLIYKIGFSLTFDLLYLLHNKCNIETRKYEELLYYYINNNIPIFLKDLKINGVDLISMGFKGKEIGLILHKLLLLVHKNEKNNNIKFLKKSIFL